MGSQNCVGLSADRRLEVVVVVVGGKKFCGGRLLVIRWLSLQAGSKKVIKSVTYRFWSKM